MKQALGFGYNSSQNQVLLFILDALHKDFEQAEIEVIVLNEENRRLVAKRILEELEVGIVNENTLKEFNEIIVNAIINYNLVRR